MLFIQGEREQREGEDAELLGVNSLTNALIAKACHPLTICINKYSVIMPRPCAWRIAAIFENILLSRSKLETSAALREMLLSLKHYYTYTFFLPSL